VFAIKEFYKNDNTYTAAQWLFHWHLQINGNNPMPSAHAIKTRIKTFEERGMALESLWEKNHLYTENIRTV
jgi:hypothetical protein